MSRNVKKSVALVCSLVAAAMLSGCVTTGEGSYDRAGDYQMDPTPHLHDLKDREVDMDNRHAITTDENLRMLNEDLSRFFLLDRQSRLSPSPVPR